MRLHLHAPGCWWHPVAVRRRRHARTCRGPSNSTPAVSPNPSTPADGPCSDVTMTTSIDDVGLACQELWAPYGVTEVPPSNELKIERVPDAPTVVNMTDGAVSDATAQHWADASNWDSGWWKWAQANDQLFVLAQPCWSGAHPRGRGRGTPERRNRRSTRLQSLSASARRCSLSAMRAERTSRASTFRPTTRTCSWSSTAGRAARCSRARMVRPHRSSTSRRTPPCSRRASFRSDPVLGDLWFGDAGGNCQDPIGPPPAWCGR